MVLCFALRVLKLQDVQYCKVGYIMQEGFIPRLVSGITLSSTALRAEISICWTML